jgi:exosortase family protein XrtF
MGVRAFMGKGTGVPGPVILFFAKAVLLFVLWKGLYLSLLLPQRTLDEPLTGFIGRSTANVLNACTQGAPYSVRAAIDTADNDGTPVPGRVMDIYRHDRKTLRVADACNGLELMVLYIGFLICFPGRLKKKISFAVIGFVLIYVLNVIRCAVLVQIFIYYNEYLDFSHHFLFTFLIYILIFLLWFLFTKKSAINARLP